MKTKILIIVCALYLIGCSHENIFNEKESNTITRKLTILAIEESGGSEIDGGTYRVSFNNNSMGEFKMQEGGINVPNLNDGMYTIEEINSPNGFYTNTKNLKVSVNSNNNQAIFYYYYENKQNLPLSFNLDFYDNNSKKVLETYHCIRIGEYFWTDRNFTHSVPAGKGFENDYPITQKLLNKYLDCAFLDKSKFQLADINNFEKYYGRYYSRSSIDYMNTYGEFHSKSGRKINGWKLPSTADYQQLFAMCPISNFNDKSKVSLNERDIRFALGAKEGDNPMAFDISDPTGGPHMTYWFNKNYTKNIYAYNMMPAGARLNGDGLWSNGLSPSGDWDGKKGDIYHLFYAYYTAAINSGGSLGYVALHDYADTRGLESYHMLNVRWVRTLTDQELGYKLYINDSQTNIIKLGLDEPVPSGFQELIHGYLRGLYVQYILDNKNPQVTVAQLVEASHRVDDIALQQ